MRNCPYKTTKNEILKKCILKQFSKGNGQNINASWLSEKTSLDMMKKYQFISGVFTIPTSISNFIKIRTMYHTSQHNADPISPKKDFQNSTMYFFPHI